MAKNKIPASLSLDLDNTWSYLKIHGDKEWEEYPSHFSTFIPIILDFLKEHRQRITFFVVGKDAQKIDNRKWLKKLTANGHELGNHSFHHEPWMQDEEGEQVIDEINQAHQAIVEATGVTPLGFRGPGFCHSTSTLNALKKLGYEFDSSVLATSIGPLARLYYFWKMENVAKEEGNKRKNLFGNFSYAFLPNSAFYWKTKYGDLLEIPVTTVPLLRVPFHLSYLLWLSQFSENLSWAYLKFSIKMCKVFNISPSILLHPPDFLGKEDLPSLSFFPGMNLSRKHKLMFASRVIKELQKNFPLTPMSTQVVALRNQNQSLKLLER